MNLHSQTEWVDLISNFHSVLKGKSVAEIKDTYRKHVKGWNLYGSSVYNVKQSANSKLPKDLWVAIHPDAMHLLAPYTEAPILSYEYAAIAHYGPSASSFFMMAGDLMNAQKHVFMTKQANVIANLLHIYSEQKKKQLAAQI
jgi:hypothetical protein